MDGNLILQQDQRIRAVTGDNLRGILEKDYWWPSSADQLYRPVATSSFLFNYAVLGNGTGPFGYHATNFLLHATNVWLVFELGLLLFQGAGPAFFAAALWGVHPVGVESVANIAGRADLLAATAVLGALVLYIRTAEATGRRRAASIAGVFALSALGVFSKENAAVLVGLMLLWDITFGRWGARRMAAYAAAALPVGLLLGARWAVFRQLPLPPVNVVDNPLLAAGFWASRFTAIKIVGSELWLLLCPIRLTADRSYHAISVSGPGDPLAWLAFAVVAAILGIVIARYRKDRLLFWAAGFLGLTLLPTSNLVVTIGAAMAERFLYLPSIGFAVAAAALAWRLKSQRTATIVLGVAIVLCAGRTFARNRVWNDELTLAAADVETSPDSFRLHAMLGQNLYSRDPRNNLDPAIRELETSWRILKPLPAAQNLETAPAVLGMYYGLKGDREGGLATPQGKAWYEKSLARLLTAKELSIAFQKAYDQRQLTNGKPLPALIGFEALDFYIGQAYWRLGRRAEAIEWYRLGRRRRPDNPVGYDTLARAYLAASDWDDAAVVLDEKLLITGSTPASIAALRDVYSHVQAGACATVPVAGIAQLNPGCPRLHSDTCKALSDLEQVFTDGRRADRAREFHDAAARSYGCGAGR
jgi:tetratricopeptide (TPR) repeat protein